MHIFLEDDFVETRDRDEEIKAGVVWACPGDKTFHEQQLRWKAGFKRAGWANGNHMKCRHLGRGAWAEFVDSARRRSASAESYTSLALRSMSNT